MSTPTPFATPGKLIDLADARTRRASTPAPTLAPGSRLGPYEIVAPLKSGGMATLWLGRRVGPVGFARHVAIKVVHAHLARDPGFVEMFLDEARLAARIQHPNVVHTEELGEQDGLFYLAMEYVHGCTLAQFMKRLLEQRRGLSIEMAVHIAMKVADGLHAAHELRDDSGRALGVVHRDISPQNILLSYAGQVKLIDFGVAKSVGQSTDTTSGSLKGKIRYMAPEQAWGRAIDRRTDVYALGIVLWEALTHRRLFVAENDFAALAAVRSPDLVPPSAFVPTLGETLDHAVMTALATEPAARFRTAQALRRALGGACPRAHLVEPDDLGALVVSVMERDIAVEMRAAPEIVTRAMHVTRPDAERKTGAMAAFTRELEGDAETTADPAREENEASVVVLPVSNDVAKWTVAIAFLVLAAIFGARFVSGPSTTSRTTTFTPSTVVASPRPASPTPVEATPAPVTTDVAPVALVDAHAPTRRRTQGRASHAPRLATSLAPATPVGVLVPVSPLGG